MLDTQRRGLPRYIELLSRSIVELWRRRGTTVIVQSPSVLLAFLAVLLALPFRLRVAVDAHNESVRPFAHNSVLSRRLVRAIIRRAYLVIVTNNELAEEVTRLGGRVFVLPDAIPTPSRAVSSQASGTLPIALIICTYASDEPLDVFVDTARNLIGVAEVRLTGRPTRAAAESLRDAPENMRALGFLSTDDYWTQLAGADVIIDLTLKKNCLVCGAYEAIAVGKPPVLSMDVSNQRVFGDAAILVRNDADSLTRAVRQAISARDSNSSAVLAFRDRYMRDWARRLAALDNSLSTDSIPDQ